MATLQEMVESGEYDSYAWPGGYPLFYLEQDNSIICPQCANKGEQQTTIVAVDANYEDTELYCDNCNNRIEAAYE